MSNKIYAFDDFGIKHETMSRAEIENAIQTGEIKKEVFEGSIEYEGENVPYSYVGTKLDDAIILKLLACGISPVDNALIPSEIQTYLSLPIFSIHFYYSETEIYATNAKNDYLGLEKIGIGTCKVYPNGSIKLGYYMKSNKKMNDVRYCKTKQEYDDIVKDEDTTYIVEDEDYTVDRAIASDYTDSIFDTTAFYDIRDYEDEQTRHSAFILSQVFDKSGNVYLPKVKNATKADKANVSVIPQAITGETKFYSVDQDTDYMDIEEPNFTFSEVFEKSESDTNKYLPRVKEATNAIHCNTANDANYAEASDNLYVEQIDINDYCVVDTSYDGEKYVWNVTASFISNILSNVNKPAIIHFKLFAVPSSGDWVGMTTNESMFYDGISAEKLCTIGFWEKTLVNGDIFKDAQYVHIKYDKETNRLYADYCHGEKVTAQIFLTNVYVSTLELA